MTRPNHPVTFMAVGITMSCNVLMCFPLSFAQQELCQPDVHWDFGAWNSQFRMACRKEVLKPPPVTFPHICFPNRPNSGSQGPFISRKMAWWVPFFFTCHGPNRHQTLKHLEIKIQTWRSQCTSGLQTIWWMHGDNVSCPGPQVKTQVYPPPSLKKTSIPH